MDSSEVNGNEISAYTDCEWYRYLALQSINGINKPSMTSTPDWLLIQAHSWRMEHEVIRMYSHKAREKSSLFLFTQDILNWYKELTKDMEILACVIIVTLFGRGGWITFAQENESKRHETLLHISCFFSNFTTDAPEIESYILAAWKLQTMLINQSDKYVIRMSYDAKSVPLVLVVEKRRFCSKFLPM